MAHSRLCVLVPLVVALAVAARAEEWHEAYRGGLKALARGQAAPAVQLLERAASLRPEPGRNVVTYGTNVEAQYFPYLRLAEAYLLLHDVDRARAALKRSETWGREPAAERARLFLQLDEATAPVAAPPATPVSTPAPAPVHADHPSPPAESAAPSAAPPASPPPTILTAAPPVQLSRRAPPATAALERPSPASVSQSPGTAQATASSASLEVVSHPPGAGVYLNDELIGTTDPEWGRLVRSGLPAGRQRMRLALAGYGDVIEDVELHVGAPTQFRRRLVPAGNGGDRRLVLFGALAVVLLGLTAWALRRPRAADAGATPLRTPIAETPGRPARPTPPGMGSPGVVRDAQGVERFGDYRLVGALGRGGMASVYKAERHGELCAIKRPLAAFLEEPEFLERFLREAEIGRTLNHPNIIRILERGELGGVPYFTMEIVAGETVQAQLHRQGRIEPRAAARIVVQVAEALDYAHLKGVVHRDLKPSNIMVLADGTTKVMDFGIARARRFEGLTVTGSFLGSPEYVAPETVEGKSADARSDLYSLGVVFYEMLVGRRPFSADTPFAILRKHLTEVPVRPTSLQPGLPLELERITLRLLSKQPEQRPDGAEDLVVELRDFLNRGPDSGA